MPSALRSHPKIAAVPALDHQHAFQASLATSCFQTLGIGAAINRGSDWFAVHGLVSVVLFEFAHGKGSERNTYNARAVERVRREKRTLLAHHAGFSDFFVPIFRDGKVEAVLVTGPFATRRPTTRSVIEHWRWLTGRHGHPSDREFSHYLSMTLGTLTLEREEPSIYRRLLESLASLIAGRGEAQSVADEVAKCLDGLRGARFVDLIWEITRQMIDERTAREWMSPQKTVDLKRLGMDRLPEHVVVALSRDRRAGAEVVDQLLRQDAFQRASVDLARKHQAISGRVGDHGVMFLVGNPWTGSRARQAQVRLADEASALARRRFGLELHVGLSSASGPAALSERFEQALATAERALSRGTAILTAEPSLRRAQAPVRRLRFDLGAPGERPSTLASRFERYIEAVGNRCGYRIESARVYLEAGFDEAARALLAIGGLEERRYLDMCADLETASREAITVSEVFAAYRRAVSDLVDLVERPARATQDRSLRRAVAYVHKHFTEPLRMPEVAKVAGFAPNYFSQLFKRRERMTFEQYVLQLRIEHAKQLLAVTDLSAERVAQLSGFGMRQYFHRVFKEAVGKTPAEFRKARPFGYMRKAGRRR
jgi:AraC-like DNA-binding protein